MPDITPLFVLGAATALLEVADLVRAINAVTPRYEILGAFDDNAAQHGTSIAGNPVLGGLADAKTNTDGSFVYAISSYKRRLDRIALFDKFGIPRTRFPALIHPAAHVSPSATIGHGCLLWNDVFVNVQTRMGDFCIAYASSSFSPYVRLDDFAMVGGMAFVGASVHLGEGSFVGGNATAVDGIKVAPGGMIAAGSAAYHDIPAGVLVVGNPARPTPDALPVADAITERWIKAEKEPA